MTGPKPTTPDGNGDGRQPFWRRHFPVEAQVDAAHSRREFAGGLAASAACLACGQAVLNNLSSSTEDSSDDSPAPPMVLEKKFDQLRDGEAMLFHYPDHRSPCILIRLADEVAAFSQKCTHLACPVIPNIESGMFECPCHKGAFDLSTGAAVSGPPRRSLPRVQVNVAANGSMTVTGMAAGSS